MSILDNIDNLQLLMGLPGSFDNHENLPRIDGLYIIVSRRLYYIKLYIKIYVFKI